MPELLSSLSQHQMLTVVAFLDWHQNGGEPVMVADEIFWRTRLQNGGDSVGNHLEEKIDPLMICDMKRFQFKQSPLKRPAP
jgi:hypothetical protein